MAHSVLIPIADGSEEIETITLADVLVRAGAKVTLAHCERANAEIRMSRGVRIFADCSIQSCEGTEFDLIALPGGMPGAQHLSDCAPLLRMLRQHQKANRWLAAICAAPAVVLQHHHIFSSAQMTCHPAFQSQIPVGQLDSKSAVVIDDSAKLVTSQGPGTALNFALTLVAVLFGDERAKAVAEPMVLTAPWGR